MARVRKPRSKRPFPLYHWSPSSRRERIRRYGLKPKSLSRCGQWRPPYICFSDSPSWAWAASAQMQTSIKRWDLWMMWSTAPSGYEELEVHRKEGKPNEFRVYERVMKRDIWFVGSRRIADKR